MIVPEYTPGEWYAVVAGGVVLLLAPSTPPEVVRDVWASAPERGGGLGAQLDALVRHGIGGLHPFAAVDLAGGQVHTALRGDVEVEVVRGTRAEVLAAPDVVSWSERSVGAAEEVTVRVSGAGRGPALPIVSGVVRASRVRVRLTGAEPVRDAPAAASEPVVLPASPTPVAVAPTRETPAADVRETPAADAPVAAEPVALPAAAPTGARSEAPTGSGGSAAASESAAAEVPAADTEHEASSPLSSRAEQPGPDAPAAAEPTDAEPAPTAPAPSEPAHAGPAHAGPAHAAPAPVATTSRSEAPTGRGERGAASEGSAETSERARRSPSAGGASEGWAGAPAASASAAPAGPVPAAPAPAPAPAPAAPAGGSGVPTPALPFVPPAPPAPVLPGPASADDHDGLTILSGELASIRQHLPSWAVSQTGDWPSGAGVPTPSPAPGVSGALPVTPAAASATAQVPVPRLALSTGATVPVDAVVLIGRAPQADRAPDGAEARLVTVPSPEQDISRTHAEVRLEQGRVLVTDLYSTNGITVASGALPPRRVTAGEPVAVGEGDVVDLGDGVTFTVEPGA